VKHERNVILKINSIFYVKMSSSIPHLRMLLFSSKIAPKRHNFYSRAVGESFYVSSSDPWVGLSRLGLRFTVSIDRRWLVSKGKGTRYHYIVPEIEIVDKRKTALWLKIIIKVIKLINKTFLRENITLDFKIKENTKLLP